MARLADTLIDSGRWAPEVRAKHLTSWEMAIAQKNKSLWKLDGSLGSFSDSEAQLLLKGGEILEAFFKFTPGEKVITEEVLQILFSAMKWDLKTFGSQQGAGGVIYGCADTKIFDWYCYSIAGCVGSFWVRAFGLPSSLENLAIEYGKGLQRINILRDVVEDARRGRSYLPRSLLAEFNIEGAEPWKKPEWMNFVRSFILETKQRLSYGANFCDAIPYRNFRLRWASRMPLVIGLKTLEQLERQVRWSETSVKISRASVKRLAFKSLVAVVLSRRLSGRVAR